MAQPSTTNFPKLTGANMEGSFRLMGEWAKGWQAISAEMTDYSKRSLEDGTQTFEKLLTARSLDQVLEIQTSYARRCYDDYMHQLSRLGSMYADLAKDSAKPLERFIQSPTGGIRN
jgi:hypothetical protein